MKIYNAQIVNAKKRALELLAEYNRRQDGSSFKEWMETYLEELPTSIMQKEFKSNELIKDYKHLLQETDALDGDTFQVEETTTDRTGRNVKNIVTYSKTQMTKDIINAEDFINKNPQVYQFETRLAAYMYAKNKVDARPWYSKAFFFWRTYQESKMLDKMQQDLYRDYEITEKQLDTLMRIAGNNTAIEETESISEGGFRTLVEEARIEFKEIREAAKEVNISDEEKKIIKDYVENEKELDDFAPELLIKNRKLDAVDELDIDEEFQFNKTDIISTNNKMFDNEEIEFNENELKTGESQYAEPKDDKTKLLRESLNEEFENPSNNKSQKQLNKEDNIKINISIDKN